MRLKPHFWMLACWITLACSTTSQNNDDSAAVCTPGATQSCAGPGACSGFQTCSSTGREFGACECGGAGGSSASGGAAGVGAMSAGGSAGSGTGGTAGTSEGGAAGSGSGGVAGSVAVGGAAGSAGVAGIGGAAGSAGAGGTGPDPLEQLGARCTTNADCGGLTCITPTGAGWDGASPAKGYCTRECTADPSVCGAGNPCREIASDPSSVSYCLLGCIVGTVPLGSNEPFPATHCRGRVELACQPDSVDSLNGCWPMCVTDADCGTLSCNLSTGRCDDTELTGGPIGTACEPGDNTPCAQFCVGLGDGGGVCTGVCTLGTAGIPGACGSNPVPGSLQESVCMLPGGGNPGIGDLGFCAQTCNCTADCSSTAKCVQVDAQVAQATLRPGVCTVLNAGDTELTSCN